MSPFRKVLQNLKVNRLFHNGHNYSLPDYGIVVSVSNYHNVISRGAKVAHGVSKMTEVWSVIDMLVIVMTHNYGDVLLVSRAL